MVLLEVGIQYISIQVPVLMDIQIISQELGLWFMILIQVPTKVIGMIIINTVTVIVIPIIQLGPATAVLHPHAQKTIFIIIISGIFFFIFFFNRHIFILRRRRREINIIRCLPGFISCGAAANQNKGESQE